MNHVILIGRLVKDPELRYTPNGQAVVNFMLAVDKGYSKDKKAELQAQGKQTADFIRVVAWNKTAELCGNYLAKGKQCAVTGSMSTGSYKSNSGETHYTTDVVANTVEFLGGASDKPAQNDDYYNPDDFKAIEDDLDIPF
ncbi:single-stranded DNA-binding protein 2-like [Procambarus clarkii]|uniref:single-stranded DNA-binding protein 2-like n=1 Tax=Procambarus clarkii TaxID=6728 RepID=UPI003744906A